VATAEFDPIQYYASYPTKIIARPGYPARAAYKSTLMFHLFGSRIYSEIDRIASYADIGGCFGFGANSMVYQIEKRQGARPRTLLFEISPEFTKIGRQLFPQIEYVESEFGAWKGDIDRFDLITLFDIVEHVVDPEPFLRDISERCRYVMLMTPLETSGEYRGNRAPNESGDTHKDGHVNFFSTASYEELLSRSGLEILDSHVIRTLAPNGAELALSPENTSLRRRPRFLLRPRALMKRAFFNFPGISWRWKRKLFGGGHHISLCRPRVR
jgi:hypothetical protein